MIKMEILTDSLERNIEILSHTLPLEESSDIVTRRLKLGGLSVFLVTINGLTDSFLPEYILSVIQEKMLPGSAASTGSKDPKAGEPSSGQVNPREDKVYADLKMLADKEIGYYQTEFTESFTILINALLNGVTVILADGCSKALLLDCRRYPSRSIEEPETEKVTKGAKDGFVESITSNTGMIRRRVKSRGLVFKSLTLGDESKTDIFIAYIKELADTGLVGRIETALKSRQLTSVTMGSKSIEEILVKKKWFNPLPSMISTERPDVAASYILEGHVAVLVDTSPYVLILPATFFQFTQSPEDYYKNPIVGNHMRLIRFISIIISLYLMPVFLLLGNMTQKLPEGLRHITGEYTSSSKLFLYCMFIEFGLDLFAYASSHAYEGFNSSLSIVGGLIVSDIAINLDWASREVIFYGAVTMLATLTMSYIEFGEALRIYRVLMLLTTGIGGLFRQTLTGFITGFALVTLSIVTTRTFTGKSYFWPLVPFNWKALKTLLFRYTTPKAQPSNQWNRS